MTTTQTETAATALAVREFSDQQIRTRLKAAAEPGFGLAQATAAQLNMIYLLAKHYDVDPAIDITIYQGRPWFTIDGRVRLMRRHPQYRGYKTRPLTAAEKEAWGYSPGEIVVECTIRTVDWGEIAARGKVSEAELTKNTPTGSHPQEMAEKRAIARASRMAFGQDVPDEDEAGFAIEERNSAERVRRDAAEYQRIYGSEESSTAYDLPERAGEPQSQATAQPSRASEDYPPSDARAADLVTVKTDADWKEWLDTEKQARVAGLDADTSRVKLGISRKELRQNIETISTALKEHAPEVPF